MKKILFSSLFLISEMVNSQMVMANVNVPSGALHQDPSLCSYGYNTNCNSSSSSQQNQSNSNRYYQYPYDDYCEARPKGGKICQHNYRGMQHIHHIAEYDVKGNVIYHRGYYFDGMTVKFEANYDSKGNRQGIYKRYHENGQLEGSGNYVNDELHGEYRNFDKNGRLIRIEKYNHGILESATDYSNK